jgi:hypothetical protein
MFVRRKLARKSILATVREASRLAAMRNRLKP